MKVFFSFSLSRMRGDEMSGIDSVTHSGERVFVSTLFIINKKKIDVPLIF